MSTGDSFEWAITVHMATLLNLMEDLNLTYGMPPEYTDLFVGVSSMNYRIDILSVSDEMDYIGIKYVNVSCSVSLVLPGTTTIPNIGQFSNIIVKFQDNYTGAVGDLISGGGLMYAMGGLFLPTNMNWTKLVDEFNTIKSFFPEIPTDLNVTALENGINANYPGGAFEFNYSYYYFAGTLSEVDVTVTYTENGVLSSVIVLYGGATLLTVGFAQPEEIFGYELSILIIITTGAVIGLVFYIKKKKRKI
ncbi:MAG: hypothetical protein JSV23_03980 [Promethearchaeota archaeon]|nr:MAG: hypothetical protein JSV23_03980 [Candidatus Lokiarchaeota archaeon]